MKRLFSGNRSGASSPKFSNFTQEFKSRSRSNSSSGLPPPNPHLQSSGNEVSPELAPIVTLLSAQAHRRYNEGVFMLLHSINSDGEPVPNRQWREVYGVLLGTQLAVWNVEEIEKYQNDTEALLNASSKPDYINFTDSSFRAVDKLDNGLNNIIIVSTTLKNQFLLQFPELEDFHRWSAAFRLSNFECTSLQEAYTGALLSAKGSKLSDIRTILSDTKFDYEDWVSVRFGSGMPWKRCFAVIEQPSKKSKNGKIYKGSVSFYKDEKKNKKTAMAIIKDASAAYALYPQAAQLIDQSTMIKLEGSVHFDSSKRSLPKEASVYFMPEQHSAVPGYDTLIRFLVPLLNTFALYGRPKRLNANKNDSNSLLFGLPVLPHVHYLEVDDLILLASNPQSTNWLLTEWRDKIKEVLGRKLSSGYTGCGSSHGVLGAIKNSTSLTNGIEFAEAKLPINRPMSPLSPSFLPAPKFKRDSMLSKESSTHSVEEDETVSALDSSPMRSEGAASSNRNSEISQLYEDYSKINTAPNNIYLKPNGSSSQGNFQNSKNSLNEYHDARSSNKSAERLTQRPRSSEFNGNYNSNPYTEFKNKSNTALDEDYEDFDTQEIQNGLSAMSVNNSKNKSQDIFDPTYSNEAVDEVPIKQAEPEPVLKLQSSSKSLQGSAKQVPTVVYTSGRVSANQSPIQFQQTPAQRSQQPQQLQPQPQQAPVPPQHQHQQGPAPLVAQPPPTQPPQQHRAPYPTGGLPSASSPTNLARPQGAISSQPQPLASPQQQQFQRPPVQNQQKPGSFQYQNNPYQQQQPQNYSKPGPPPHQAQQPQQPRPYPPNQGPAANQLPPQQRFNRGPPPAQQQLQQYPPQGYQQRSGPAPQQQYAQGYPAQQQKPPHAQRRPVPQGHYPGQGFPPQQQQQPAVNGGYRQGYPPQAQPQSQQPYGKPMVSAGQPVYQQQQPPQQRNPYMR